MNMIITAIGIAFIGLLILAYNKAIGLRNYMQEAFSTMDVYLKKRWDLIPNLIELVKSYASHEKEVFDHVTKLRCADYSGLQTSQKIDINEKLNAGIGKILAVAENYPEIKANQNYALLMTQLTEVEEDIANSRKYYNGTVRELNTYVETFPSSVICAIFGIKPAKLFEINESERSSIKVDLD